MPCRVDTLPVKLISTDAYVVQKNKVLAEDTKTSCFCYFQRNVPVAVRLSIFYP